MLDGVVITGGEPTLQPEGLLAFLQRARGMGYLCKLDTNGSRPAVVADLLEHHLLDYVALDIKMPPQRYPELGGSAEWEPVARTLMQLRGAGIPFECRTTFIPQLTLGDIAEMAAAIAPVPRWALQAYRLPARYKETDRFRIHAAPHPPEDFRRAAEVMKACGGEVISRG
jgi:pyruvate formate lyase activating enzyme